METDSDGNVMGPATDETPAWIGVLPDEMAQRSPPPKLRGKVSSDFDRRTSVQRWGRKTVCEVQLWVLNGTWAEVAEADAQESTTFCSRVIDWCSLHISALFCGFQMDFHTHTIFPFAISALLAIVVFASLRASARLI